MAALLWSGNTGSKTASDHITTTQLTLIQPPKRPWRGQQTLIRTDSADGTHAYLDWSSRQGRWLSQRCEVAFRDEVVRGLCQGRPAPDLASKHLPPVHLRFVPGRRLS